jgi:anti-anti-sigma factor
MPVEQWSDDVSLVHLASDPQFTDEIGSLDAALDQHGPRHVVLDFNGVGFLTSSNLARLLKLRKRLHDAGRRLILCAIGTKSWTTFMVTGLDKVFEFSDGVPTALATLQLTETA